MASFVLPDEGAVLLKHNEVFRPCVDRLMIFQDFDQLFPWKTVQDNITYPLRILKIEKDKSKASAIALKQLKNVGMLEHARKYPRQLSGGMKQRAALAKAIALQPQVLLMDEPFGSLDAITRSDMQILLREVWKKTGITIVFVTHDVNEALFLGTRIVIMGNNKTSDSGNILDIINMDEKSDKHEIEKHIMRKICGNLNSH